MNTFEKIVLTTIFTIFFLIIAVLVVMFPEIFFGVFGVAMVFAGVFILVDEMFS